ncbi:HTH domain-containing protein [Haloarcula laminariae]|uniref:HTH domain-containing protein n=1 Tax=Haloarcula laminariae TaxID=2961577 RepID=UPI002405ABA5|nr:HTH domain-containing protein [Halomicroarcula sp. FL173]
MSHNRRLAVYLRTPVASGTEQRQTSVLGRADALRQQRLVDEVTVTYWSRLSTGVDPHQNSDIRALEQWAADNGCSLAPAFDRRDRHSAVTGDDSVVTLPIACVAYWEGGELLGVYPHAGPSGHCTVADGLDRIEAALRSGERLNHTGARR